MVLLGFLKRETLEQKATRLAHKKKIQEAYDTAKFEAQLAAAKRDGKAEGLKGNRTFMDRVGDAMKAAGEASQIMEEALGGTQTPTKRVAPKKSRRKSSSQPIVIVLGDNDEKIKKPKTLREQVWDI